MDVPWDNRAEEQHAVDEDVEGHSAEEGDAQGRKEDVDHSDGAAFEDHGCGV